MKILVTYLTRYASTREVAERVGAILRESGALVEAWATSLPDLLRVRTF